ncbi:MAG: DNA polymerase [Candidatus Electronema aureum]|uniref:DNA polymerase n=1 Tax=Candidatus Electronema aureum TaxID=2005002 RepID=A0A521G4X3_9BACT|nr:MAG: DNA polymerase [Candidatus Electronema aureum]
MTLSCEHKTPDPAALAQLLRQTRSVLACHVEIGIINYPATPELRHFAAHRPVSPVVQSRKSDKLPSTAQSLPAAEKKPQAPISSRAEIAEQLAQCRRCPDAAAPPILGFGSAAPRLVVVGDYFIGAERGQNVLWGREEDELFWKMMTAIGLSRETVYVTNVFKCAQRELPQSTSKAEQNCRPWLEAELQAIRPQLICALGETAARVLIGGNTPLARLRLQKKFHPCCCPSDSIAQVLPTYHPRLLLQHTEMKKAAWEDLQALQWRLQAGN